MKTRLVRIALLAVLSFVYIYLTASIVYHKDNIIKKGEELYFETAPLDPRDPIRGKYVRLNFQLDQARSSEYVEYGTEVFVILEKNADNEPVVIGMQKHEPKEGLYLKVKAQRSEKQSDGAYKTFFNLPFDRFYLEESKAPKAEELYLNAQVNPDSKAEAVVYIYKGEAVMQDLLIDGLSIHSYLKETSPRHMEEQVK